MEHHIAKLQAQVGELENERALHKLLGKICALLHDVQAQLEYGQNASKLPNRVKTLHL